ncbi:Nat2p [Sporobolomyces koalae]|uniref:Nat2p n=1 Tax=Sporobolomyces koalae TaxID=500713 RepID=UPI003178C4CB
MLPTLVRASSLRPLSTQQLRPLVRPLSSSVSSASRAVRLSSLLLPQQSAGLLANTFRFQSSRSYSSSGSESSSNGSPPPPPPPGSLGLTARLKLLFKTHGWTALTLYLVLSFIDFSLTFLLVWSIGADKVKEFEDYILSSLGWRRSSSKKHLEQGDAADEGVLKQKVREWKEKHQDPERRLHPVKEVQEPNGGAPAELGTVAATGAPARSPQGYSAYATTAVLAYAIHKTALLPVRVGLTVWSTPKVVRLLQSWGQVLIHGWRVGRMPATAEIAAQAAAKKIKPAKVK